MNLQATIDIYGGGPGSGCHGPNCGRPSTDRSLESVDLPSSHPLAFYSNPVKVPFPVASTDVSDDLVLNHKLTKESRQDAVVLMKDVVAIEPVVDGDKVQELMHPRQDLPRPTGWIKDGKFYLSNGHHRMSAYWLQGKQEVPVSAQFISKDIKAGGPGSGCRGENCGRPPLGVHQGEKSTSILGRQVSRLSSKDVGALKEWFRHPAVAHSGDALGKYQAAHPGKEELAARASDAGALARTIADDMEVDAAGPVYAVRNSQGQPIGVVELTVGSDHVEVERLATHPAIIMGEMKEKGIGTALMLQAAKVAAEHGVGVKLSALEGARTFYGHLGMHHSLHSRYSWSSSQAKAFAEYGDKIAAMSRDEVEMNIRQAIEFESKNPILIGKPKELDAGGEGSGCRGENCGRPSTGGSKVKTKMANDFMGRPSVKEYYVDGVRVATYKKGSAYEHNKFGAAKVTTHKTQWDPEGLKHFGVDHTKLEPWERLGGTKHAYKNEDIGQQLDELVKKHSGVQASAVGDVNCFIRKEGSQHCVKSHSGKNLGCYPSKGGAKKRLAQVEYFKHLKGGGPGSGRKPGSGKTYSDLNPVKQHERARLNPKQQSIFGPGHTKEIISHPAMVKQSVKQQVKSLQFDEDGEPMVGNMARNTRTEQNDWFDPARRRGDKNTKAISSQRAKRVEGMGEPDIPDFGTAYMDPKTTYHPPSLKKPDRVPADDPREKSDKYLDVTKRKEAQKMRGDLLRRARPGGNPPLIPIGTTAMNNPAGVSNPIVVFSQAQKRKRVIQRPARPLGGKRTSIPLGRSY